MEALKKDVTQRLQDENRKLRHAYKLARATLLDENKDFKHNFINAAKEFEKENEV